jgi:outer membrane protein OmpA-like peptidoglycan-associated protein
MKSTLRKVFFLIAFLGSTALYAQTSQYYVVIGAFAKESNAKKFVGFAHSRFFGATYEKKPKSRLFFVYVIKTNNKEEAYTQVRILQKEATFSDAWVYRGSLIPVGSPPVTKVEPQPVIVEPVAVIDTIAVEEPVAVDSVAEVPTAVVLPIDTTSTVAIAPDINASALPPTKKAKGKYFKFAIIGPDGKPFPGKVHNVDLKLGRDLASYNSFDYNDILLPTSQRQEPMTFICGIFGYKEVMQLVDYTSPALTEGVTRDEYEAWVVPFKLERLNKGDVSVMYNVSFYKDAVIMLPRAKEELDELVHLMNSNPAYVIKIHGHTNGNDKRKIIGLGETRNYFDVKGSIEKNGTSKELSKDRAEAVREYLVEHGIARDRMDIMAWGGTNMLVNELSSSSRLNDRIEIEILKD